MLFFDACLMGMIESAYQVRDIADYYVSGQNLLFAKLPYERYLRDLTNETSPATLAERIVDLYNQGEREPITISALDLRQLRTDAPGDLAARIDTLSQLLLNALPDPAPADHPVVQAIKSAYSKAQKFDYDSSNTIDEREGYVDLVDFVKQLSADTSLSADIRAAATAVADAAVAGDDRVVLKQRGKSGIYLGAYWNFAQAHGISIYLPLGEQDHRPTRYDPTHPERAVSEPQLPYYTDCAQMAFACDAPHWGDLLERLTPTVTIIRTGPDGQAGSNLAADVTYDTRPFNTPAQLNPTSFVYLPLIVR
ncbi:clostripain-related cysteine peptidase [Oscillochloris sp. ZM17-4]|uniref:clostripain-related cysteine peptidase n=1 Tax=Oscillochloris sp. ZM17-4 TaxID=2866714 RepID=UPI00351D7D7B